MDLFKIIILFYSNDVLCITLTDFKPLTLKAYDKNFFLDSMNLKLSKISFSNCY